MFTAALFMVAKTWKQSKCPLIGDWIKKMLYVYTMELYSAMRKDEILPFVTTWMAPENIMLYEISQIEKAKKHMNSLTWDIKTEYNK